MKVGACRDVGWLAMFSFALDESEAICHFFPVSRSTKCLYLWCHSNRMYKNVCVPSHVWLFVSSSSLIYFFPDIEQFCCFRWQLGFDLWGYLRCFLLLPQRSGELMFALYSAELRRCDVFSFTSQHFKCCVRLRRLKLIKWSKKYANGGHCVAIVQKAVYAIWTQIEQRPNFI